MENSFRTRLIELQGSLSGRKFAERCSVTDSTMRGYLIGKFEPTVANLIKIASACGVTVGWLAAGEESSQGENKVAATIEPGDQAKKARLLAQGIRAENRSSELKRIAAWMDNEEEKNPDFGWLFERELERTHPSYKEFLNTLEEKKRPRQDYSVAEPEQKYNNSD